MSIVGRIGQFIPRRPHSTVDIFVDSGVRDGENCKTSRAYAKECILNDYCTLVLWHKHLESICNAAISQLFASLMCFKYIVRRLFVIRTYCWEAKSFTSIENSCFGARTDILHMTKSHLCSVPLYVSYATADRNVQAGEITIRITFYGCDIVPY